MLTVEELYEEYINQDTSFAEDVWTYFGSPAGATGEFADDPEEWSRKYASYLPSFDPASIGFAQRERDISFKGAEDIYSLTKDIGSRVYQEELGKLESSLASGIEKGREVSGRLGLKTGSIDTAIEDTLEYSGNKVKNLSDRLILANEEAENDLKQTEVGAVLDFEKSEYEDKKEFYQRTLAAISRLTELGAFEGVSEEGGHFSGTGTGNVVHEDTYYDEQGNECICETLISGQLNCIPSGCSPIQGSNDPDWCDPQLPSDHPLSCAYGHGGSYQFCIDHPEALECQEGPGLGDWWGCINAGCEWTGSACDCG